MIEYANVEELRKSEEKIRGRNVFGYGSKITLPYFARLRGDKRFRRVYYTCYSNAGTAWIIKDGKRLVVGDLD